MREPLLDVRDLSVRFETDEGRTHAVDRFSFTLERSEVLGIVGESGCGKSVTMLSLLRLLPETAVVTGEATFEGRDLLSAPQPVLRKIRGRDISF
ncbi:MAG TPA: ATP-binding cassette domain-containing protein, partial [Nannocystaceae bacterium]|nr:ATP-binding cassette domain-containing protein [Nannocystaceae bacterium]